MNEQQLIEFFDRATRAYCAACEKHPTFTDRASRMSTDTIDSALCICRMQNDNGRTSFYSIIKEEVLEYIEAAHKSDIDAQRSELLDYVAVLMREWERINSNNERMK